MKKKILISSIILIVLLLSYGIYCSRIGVIPSPWVGWGLIILIFTSSISLIMIMNELTDEEKKIQEEMLNKRRTLNNNLYFKYQESLKNKNGNASYWGELYYNNLYEPRTIFEQNQIQLKIQNDILSYS